MAQKTTVYGYTYDKQGNRVIVYPPVNANGQPIKPHTKTMTGKIGDNVGFSMGKQGNKNVFTTEQWV